MFISFIGLTAAAAGGRGVKMLSKSLSFPSSIYSSYLPPFLGEENGEESARIEVIGPTDIPRGSSPDLTLLGFSSRMI